MSLYLEKKQSTIGNTTCYCIPNTSEGIWFTDRTIYVGKMSNTTNIPDGIGLSLRKDKMIFGHTYYEFSNGIHCSFDKNKAFIGKENGVGFIFSNDDNGYSYKIRNKNILFFDIKNKRIENKTTGYSYPCDELIDFSIDFKCFFPQDEIECKEEKEEIINDAVYKGYMYNPDEAIYVNCSTDNKKCTYYIGNEDHHYKIESKEDSMTLSCNQEDSDILYVNDTSISFGKRDKNHFFNEGIVINVDNNTTMLMSRDKKRVMRITDGGKIEIENEGEVVFTLENMNYMNRKYNIEQEAKLQDLTSNYISLTSDSSVMDDAEEQLKGLTGLVDVKRQLERFKRYCKESIKEGNPINLNMVFSGAPGTGKTTVARLVGQILYKNGILSNTNFVECSRETLIGEFIGHTAVKTHAAIQKAMGGILFVDEAYALGFGGENDFGKEAISELILAMENHRGEFCVILAGYSDEMNNLMMVNPGMKSRIQKTIAFPNYSLEELSLILDTQLKTMKYTMDEDAKASLLEYLNSYRTSKDFANAREVRNALEQVIMIQATKTLDDPLDRNLTKEYVNTFLEDCKAYEDYPPVIAPMVPMDLLKKYNEKKLSLEDNIEDIIESIVELQIYTKDSISAGTGFIISPDGYLVTCEHCVRGASKIMARRRIKNRHDSYIDVYYDCNISSVDKRNDTAIVKIQNEGQVFSYLGLDDSGKEVLPLTKVIEIGYPFGTNLLDNLSIYEGRISSTQNINYVKKYIIDILAYPGISGSPIISVETGKVIGMTQGAINPKPGFYLNYAGGIQPVWDLVEVNSIEKEMQLKEKIELFALF